MTAVIGFSFKEQFLGFQLLFLDFYHFYHVIWGMKWAKKLKTKNGQKYVIRALFARRGPNNLATETKEIIVNQTTDKLNLHVF